MNGPHLSPLEARHLLAFFPPPQQVALGHVLECATCRRLLREELGPPPAPPLPTQHDYSAIWSGVFAGRDAHVRRAAAEREGAEAAVAELLPLPVEERRERVQQEERLQNIALPTAYYDRLGVPRLAR